jgi:hypothetical protein
VTVTADHTVMAGPRPWERCSKVSLLRVVGQCADCVAKMGLQAEYGRK